MTRSNFTPVRLTLVEALEELWQIPRVEWVLRWPGQVVIAGSQTAWTAGVENAIEEYRMEFYFEENLKMVKSLKLICCYVINSFCRSLIKYHIKQLCHRHVYF